MKHIPFGKPEIVLPPMKVAYYNHDIMVIRTPLGYLEHKIGPRKERVDIFLAPDKSLEELAMGVKLDNLKTILLARKKAVQDHTLGIWSTIEIQNLES